MQNIVFLQCVLYGIPQSSRNEVDHCRHFAILLMEVKLCQFTMWSLNGDVFQNLKNTGTYA